jgi:alginate O-acetyltransferase complex protein AlgI
MLFNSYEFVFFLIATLVFYHLSSRQSEIAGRWTLLVCSLAFYSYWNPNNLALILFSIVFNYTLAGIAIRRREAGEAYKKLLIFGIATNLSILAYFKYLNFFIDNITTIDGVEIESFDLVLPLAISFFTFQQIAYLIDVQRGSNRNYSFGQYALFVAFFPQLIAGPIVHAKEMLPQFSRTMTAGLRASNLAVGLTIFGLGLFKKVVIADNIATYSDALFDTTTLDANITFVEAWGGVLAYTLQIYFDFSGYSDMAVGLGRCFGIRLPINFLAPYRATSIIEFWRRWHITLSRFLRNYVYIPLGGNQKGPNRRTVNIVTTMLLGGLWHGAGWTFVLWGGLHGIFIILNHLWRSVLGDRLNFRSRQAARIYGFLCFCLTFFCVCIAWVFFRANSLDSATEILSAMLCLNCIVLPSSYAGVVASLEPFFTFIGIGIQTGDLAYFGGLRQIGWLAFGLAICWTLPPLAIVMRLYRPVLDPGGVLRLEYAHSLARKLIWRPTPIWGIASSILAAIALLSLNQPSAFLYFQF